uniref:Ig-like domain-containing protein n=1 Tax=Oryzias latipes TaxID=8090 RepID=A0A3P9MDV4_ORYLA
MTIFVLKSCFILFTAVQAGDVVVMLGSSAILPCHISTNDRLSQITWQKTIKGKAPNDVFLIIQPKNGLKYSNEKDLRFEFIGNVDDKNGTLKFSNVTLEDEGSYTCIFNLTVYIVLHFVTVGNEEVPLATCTAAASKPKAEVRWIKGFLEGKVREELNETQHANGTTTTWNSLLFSFPGSKSLNLKVPVNKILTDIKLVSGLKNVLNSAAVKDFVSNMTT